MKKIFAICCLFAALAFVACESKTSLREEALNVLKNNTVYVLDESTGLCYAFYTIDKGSGAFAKGMTEVPCDAALKSAFE